MLLTFTIDQRNLLRDKLVQHFTIGELRSFYFEHGGDDELVIPEGSTKGVAVEKMVNHHERRGELCHLLAWACKERGSVDWAGLPVAECAVQAAKVSADELAPIDPTLSLPFIYGPSVPPDHFYGRYEQRRDVRARLGGAVPQCINLIGLRRSGKSSMLRYIRSRIGEFCPADKHPIVVTLDFQEAQYHHPAGVMEGLRRGIARASGKDPWAKHENDDVWAVKEGLEALRDSGQRLLVLIDEFERLAQYLSAFAGWGADWRAKASAGLFGLCIASARPLREIYTTCGLDSPFDNLFTSSYLGALAQDDCQRLLAAGFAQLNRPLPSSAATWIDEMAGGLPFYSQMAATCYVTQPNAAVRQREFASQAQPHFEALWRNLRSSEQQALRQVLDPTRYGAASAAMQTALQTYGLVRAEGGRLFSTAFAEFVQMQR